MISRDRGKSSTKFPLNRILCHLIESNKYSLQWRGSGIYFVTILICYDLNFQTVSYDTPQ
jgi:hypothetical protein